MASDVIKAPWSAEQVGALKRWQEKMHAYTCPIHSDVDLMPTYYGFICPYDICDYTQNWALAISFLELDKKIEGRIFS